MNPTIRIKVTLSETEQKKLQLGIIYSHKQTKTWQLSEVFYNHFVNKLHQYGEIKHKMLFDDATNACKMEFEFVKTNEKFDRLRNDVDVAPHFNPQNN